LQNVTATAQHSADAGQEAIKLAMDGLKESAQDIPRKGPEAKVAVASMEAPKGPCKKCRFAEALGCTGIHPPWSKAFGDIVLEEKENHQRH
jgi:hypothetical protein